MKKFISILALIAIAATGAFAQTSLSAGGGLFTDLSLFGNGVKYTDGDDYYKSGTRNISFGGYVFFDATYVEADISFAIGSLTEFRKSKINDKKDSKTADKSSTIQQLGFTVLGKYPIDMGAATLFPLLGVSYNMVLGGKDEDGNKMEKSEYGGKVYFQPSWLSQLGVLGGVGFDYDLTESLFLRGEVMLQCRFADKMTRDGVKDEKNARSTLGLGPVIKVGVGYKF
jgi:outer membrane protein W